MARAVLDRHLQPQRREIRVEHARVVAFVVGDVVVRVPFVGDAREERLEEGFQAVEVAFPKALAQPDAVRHLPSPVLDQVAQKTLVQALTHLAVGIAQPIESVPAQVGLPGGRQVPGLEEQRLGGDVTHVEGGQEVAAAHHVVQPHGADAALDQRVHQKRRCTRLEPVGSELSPAEQQKDVERVVDLIAEPAVAVVPVADRVPVEARQLGREHGVQIPIRVPADRRELGLQGDVDQVVEAREQADLGELADPREEAEPDVRVGVLHDGIEAAQVVAVGAGGLGRLQSVEDGLVVFVDQDRHGLTVLPAE